MSAAPRKYTVTAVLGEGGFGKVYRAKLVTPGGFSKDVALKLARGDIPEEALRRIRDEARILGLVRDRAIVSVDPPTQLDGAWAVVMEYVEGSTCRNLLHSGTLPPRVAMEIVAEVARALDKTYRQPGPDGAPLQLLHRDLKPGNIQVTPAGEVKILDFGIARAQFAERESQTTRHIGGTIGFIAPERMEGVEGPEGDVFSLGVTLHKLVTGRMPLRRERLNPSQVSSETASAESAALGLSARMRDPKPSLRPTAREVEDTCRMAWAQMTGPTLRTWAEANVPRADPLPDDGRVGQVLVDHDPQASFVGSWTTELPPYIRETASRSSRSPFARALLAAALSFVLVLATSLATLGALGAVGGVAWWALLPQPQRESPPPKPEAPEAVDTGEPDPASTARPPPPPSVTATASVASTPPPAAVRPAVAPSPSTPPAPPPAAVTWPLTVSSAPLGAQVFIDDEPIGATPVLNHPVPEGAHTLLIRLGETVGERQIRVGSRLPSRYVWRGADDWQVYF